MAYGEVTETWSIVAALNVLFVPACVIRPMSMLHPDEPAIVCVLITTHVPGAPLRSGAAEPVNVVPERTTFTQYGTAPLMVVLPPVPSSTKRPPDSTIADPGDG